MFMDMSANEAPVDPKKQRRAAFLSRVEGNIQMTVPFDVILCSIGSKLMERFVTLELL